MAVSKVIAIRGLKKRELTELSSHAKHFGMTPSAYARQLLIDNLAIMREARSKTFAQIMNSREEVDETELDKLVEEARTEFHKSRKG